MQYFVKRGEQSFGPYSLADLQRYVQSGNIALTDLTQSEGMTDWVPVSQVLGNIPATALNSGGATLAPAPELIPLPPNLHWAILLVLNAVTRGLFNMAWALVQANWARKLVGDNKPMVLVAMYPASIVAGLATIVIFRQTDFAALGFLFILAGVIMLVVGVFSIRAAMEDYYNSTENIGLRLSGVMTFFFSTVYLQYHINAITRWKRTGVLK
jgi:GYF domain 2